MLKVLLVEDHPITLRGIQDVLEDEPDLEIVGIAATGQDALEKISSLHPEIVVLDYKLPDMFGSDIAAEISRQGWEIQIVVLSAYCEPAIVNEMFKAGVKAYLLKTGMVHELAFALRSVAQGNRWFSPEIWEVLTQSEKAANPIRSEEEEEEEEERGITIRKLEILKRVALGRTDGQIALELGVTTKAINRQLERILVRFGAPNRTNAVYLATKRGWI